MRKFKPNSLVPGLSDDDYHRQLPPDEHFFSSSQVKDMLKDPDYFIQKYIHGTIEKETSVAFDIGTYFHTAILEPDRFDDACTVYRAGRRSGKQWERFKNKHKGKIILTLSDALKAKNLIQGIEQSDLCWSYVDYPGSEVETSLFIEIMGVRVKVRFDLIRLGKDYSFIADLKSTTGSPKDMWAIQKKISSLNYDLSGALYVDAINKYIEDNNLPYAKVKEFVLLFATKDYVEAKPWILSEKSLAVGRAKYQYGLDLIRKYQKLNWQTFEEAGFIDPLPWEKSQWLEDVNDKKKTDLF